jgi:Flp pilus assembly pilin Flp
MLHSTLFLTRINRGHVCGERGQTLVEYGLIVAMIAIATIASLTAFQSSTTNLYETVMQASEAMVDAVT